MKRNVIADALRGSAGLCILLLHLCEPYGFQRVGTEQPPIVICGHVYLCVEFFLMLMGFMLSRAYDRRWGVDMTLGSFFRRRLVRLHPLVISGSVLGLLVFAATRLTGLGGEFDECLVWIGPRRVALVFLMTLVMVPSAWVLHLNPFNPCSWTLYYEYAANLLYALFVRRLGRWVLAILSLVAGLWTVTYALHVDINAWLGIHSGLLAEVAGRTADSIASGWGTKPVEIYGGFVRLCFPFLFGLLLARLGWKIRIPRFGLTICLTVFLAVLFLPIPSGPLYRNGLYELFVLFVVLPFLLLASEGTPVDDPKAAACWTFLAELSYPIYMSHYPFIRIYAWWVRCHSHACSAAVCIAVGAVLFLLMVGFGFLMMRYYDERVRRLFKLR